MSDSLSLRIYPHPDLRQMAQSIEIITPEIIALAEAMMEMVEAQRAVGLAAPQVGKLVRLFVYRNEVEEGERHTFGPLHVAINPILSFPSKERVTMKESCLSLPDLPVEVERPQKIHLRCQNLKGEWVEGEESGYLARVVMHENDHLNGRLIIDRASLHERKRIKSFLRVLKRSACC